VVWRCFLQEEKTIGSVFRIHFLNSITLLKIFTTEASFFTGSLRNL